MNNSLIMAIALVLIIEGIMPAFFPNKWSRYVQKLAKEPSANIQLTGFTLIILGGLLLYVYA
jgi:uncharacterized protein